MGYPGEAGEAYLRFRRGGAAADLEAFLLHSLDFLLERGEAETITRMPPETRLREDLGADSLLVAELVFLLEELFGIQLTNESIESVSTLGDLQALVQRETAAR